MTTTLSRTVRDRKSLRLTHRIKASKSLNHNTTTTTASTSLAPTTTATTPTNNNTAIIDSTEGHDNHYPQCHECIWNRSHWLTRSHSSPHADSKSPQQQQQQNQASSSSPSSHPPSSPASDNTPTATTAVHNSDDDDDKASSRNRRHSNMKHRNKTKSSKSFSSQTQPSSSSSSVEKEAAEEEERTISSTTSGSDSSRICIRAKWNDPMIRQKRKLFSSCRQAMNQISSTSLYSLPSSSSSLSSSLSSSSKNMSKSYSTISLASSISPLSFSLESTTTTTTTTIIRNFGRVLLLGGSRHNSFLDIDILNQLHRDRTIHVDEYYVCEWTIAPSSSPSPTSTSTSTSSPNSSTTSPTLATTVTTTSRGTVVKMPDVAEDAEENLRDNGTVLPTLREIVSCHDPEHFPFKDEMFDTVISTHALCCVPDASKVLKEIARVLRHDGYFYFLEHSIGQKLTLAKVLEEQRHQGQPTAERCLSDSQPERLHFHCPQLRGHVK